MRRVTPRSSRAGVCRRTERGTALVLAPALMLVLLALGAIAIDLSALHAQHRQLHATASAAADDAAGMLDERHLQSSGELRIDPAAATRVVRSHLHDGAVPGRLDGSVGVTVSADGTTVEVRTTVIVERVLLPSLRRGSSRERLEVRVSARLER